MAQNIGNAKNILVGASPLYVSNVDITDADYIPNAEPGVLRAVSATVPISVGVPAFNAAASYTTTLNNVDQTTGSFGYRNVGFTNNGLQISYNPSYGSVTVDQLLDTAKLFKESMEVSIATEMAEATLENVLVVFGQGSSTLSSSTLGIAGGALGQAPTERQLIAIGNAPTTASSTSERIYYARRVLSVQASQHSLARTTATTFPVTFRLLPDANYSGSEYGKIIDRTWTPA